MSCCKFNPDAVQRTQRDRALVCTLCPFAEHGPDAWMDGATDCTISGRRVAYHVISPAPTCPKGRHGSKARPGLYRIGGMLHRGSPRHYRWLAFWRLTGPCQGCGCVHRLKRGWVAIRWQWRRFRRFERGARGWRFDAGLQHTMTRGAHG